MTNQDRINIDLERVKTWLRVFRVNELEELRAEIEKQIKVEKERESKLGVWGRAYELIA